MRPVIRMRRPNKKIFIFIVILAVFYIYCYTYLVVSPSRKFFNYSVFDQSPVKDSVKLQYVVVHIDLKGAPPKLSYLHSLLPMLRDHGVNGLLMEYEDMFPYEGNLENLSARNCYKRSELKNFVEIALQLGFEVIPLIQTFGHLEFALKLEEFSYLRESPAFPDSICPSNVESRSLVMQMLKQVVSFHTSISSLKHIHVGCDEVFIMNQCKQCKGKMVSDEVLYVDYVRYISKLITSLSPNTTVLIWDDMIRKINPLSWLKIESFDNVEPVYWHYGELHKFPYVNIMDYHKKFKNKWVATAFKGADGQAAMIPILHKRLQNHFSWMKHLQTSKIPGENKVYRFKGIILTGWSRYNHMAPMCELLPVSIPSLIFNLRLINMFKSGIINSNIDINMLFSKHLSKNDKYFSCDTRSTLIPNIDYIAMSCHFNGHELYNLLYKYMAFLELTDANSRTAYEYYCQSNNVTINNIELTMYIKRFKNSLNLIQDIEKQVALAMKTYYGDDVINEYISYKSNNIKKKLIHLEQSLLNNLLFNGSWGRRPAIDVATCNIIDTVH